MKKTKPSIAELTTTAITLLCRELGPLNTARFLSQFGSGTGDYTKDRDDLIGDATVEELVAEIKRRREINAAKSSG